ncbi:MAG: division/cell wall cluster transcriptional repressor MraZ [bacterium]
MTGIYRHTIDAKGRLFIPTKLREELGDTFYVTLSTETCLSAYSEERWKLFEQRISEMPILKKKKMRAFTAHAAKVELDSQGRILLNQELRAFAGLEKNVAIVGNVDSAEIWDEETWNAVDAAATTPENLAEVFAELDF